MSDGTAEGSGHDDVQPDAAETVEWLELFFDLAGGPGDVPRRGDGGRRTRPLRASRQPVRGPGDPVDHREGWALPCAAGALDLGNGRTTLVVLGRVGWMVAYGQIARARAAAGGVITRSR